jgi:hypothetical protein
MSFRAAYYDAIVRKDPPASLKEVPTTFPIEPKKAEAKTSKEESDETMIDVLNKLIPEVLETIPEDHEWDSLIINKRKPYTYRIFRQFGKYRVCLHKFDPCSFEEAFAHPHPWPGAFMVLSGRYLHSVGVAPDAFSEPELVYQQEVGPYSPYCISNPLIWHSVQPLQTTYTIMVNGAPFENPHKAVRTTKGKDLKVMDDKDKCKLLAKFDDLLWTYHDSL